MVERKTVKVHALAHISRSARRGDTAQPADRGSLDRPRPDMGPSQSRDLALAPPRLLPRGSGTTPRLPHDDPHSDEPTAVASPADYPQLAFALAGEIAVATARAPRSERQGDPAVGDPFAGEIAAASAMRQRSGPENPGEPDEQDELAAELATALNSLAVESTSPAAPARRAAERDAAPNRRAAERKAAPAGREAAPNRRAAAPTNAPDRRAAAPANALIGRAAAPTNAPNPLTAQLTTAPVGRAAGLEAALASIAIPAAGLAPLPSRAPTPTPLPVPAVARSRRHRRNRARGSARRRSVPLALILLLSIACAAVYHDAWSALSMQSRLLAVWKMLSSAWI
jgi:hypothetical protein